MKIDKLEPEINQPEAPSSRDSESHPEIPPSILDILPDHLFSTHIVTRVDNQTFGSLTSTSKRTLKITQKDSTLYRIVIEDGQSIAAGTHANVRKSLGLVEEKKRIKELSKQHYDLVQTNRDKMYSCGPEDTVLACAAGVIATYSFGSALAGACTFACTLFATPTINSALRNQKINGLNEEIKTLQRKTAPKIFLMKK